MQWGARSKEASGKDRKNPSLERPTRTNARTKSSLSLKWDNKCALQVGAKLIKHSSLLGTSCRCGELLVVSAVGHQVGVINDMSTTMTHTVPPVHPLVFLQDVVNANGPAGSPMILQHVRSVIASDDLYIVEALQMRII